ncbi:MAG: TIGR03619 family F420-dependent LLM class oxidoreductase [Gammaproteobacteria bacterium]|nr:TIGR03619 family F420-dependent LLM class oxidoreductase [Gammaproteobacteria bacterium]
MKFGVMLPHTNRIASPDAILRTAETAEEYGFHALTVHDHIVFNGHWIVSGARGIDMPGDDRDLYEPMLTMALVAARTSRIRMVASVIVMPIREPVLFAKQAATLDVFSNGRLTIGVGVGPPLTPGDKETTKLGKHRSNAGKEYDAVGVYGNRGPRTDEYIEACIEIWQNEYATYEGKYTSFRDIEVFPKPVQKPYPPIFVGGRSEFAIQRAVRYGDGWNPSQPSAPQMRESIARLQELCVQANRKPLDTFGINIPSVIAATDEEAEAIARPTVGPLFPGETEYQERTIIGSPETFIRRVKEFQDAGVNYVELKPLYPDMDHFMEQLRLIRDEVMPAV